MEFDLDIQQYTLKELHELFYLPMANATPRQMQNAKKIMLRMHPDISKLPADYFRFYREAYDICVAYYNSQNRQSQPITETTTKYVAEEHENRDQIMQQMSKMQEKTGGGGGGGGGGNDFGTQFNQLFETKGGINHEKRRIQEERNQWFSSEDPVLGKTKNIKSVKQMGKTMDALRQQAKSNTTMTIHQTAAAPIVSNNVSAGYFHDDIEDEADTQYISSDLFGKLKFDDIRRVHKDQTILQVSERDFDKKQLKTTVKQYENARQQTIEPLKKQEADALLMEHEKLQQQKWSERWDKSQQKIQKNERNNQSILSSFMLLKPN